MKSTLIRLTPILVAVVCLNSAISAEAQLSSDQRKELADIRRDAGRVSSDIRRKKLDEAETALTELETRLGKLAEDAGLEADDKIIASVQRIIDLHRQSIERQRDPSKNRSTKNSNQVSFTKHVAPILAERCLNCHSANNNPRGGLSLDTFAGMQRGGSNGVLLVPRNPQRSLIMRKLVATGNERMPRGGEPLTRMQLTAIGLWISQGAEFDGNGNDIALKDLKTKAEAAKDMKDSPVNIAMATGDETVSFVKDIAPTIVNLCTGCHSGANPRMGLSVVDFQSLMQGSENGRVILAGDLEGSRLWQLVGAGEQPRMPQGQARITRKFHADLRTWILEGAKYDGKDPKTSLRELVPTEDQKKAQQLAAYSPQEFVDYREKRTAEIWKRVAPNEAFRFVSNSEFYVYGNASEDRLTQVASWANEHVKTLRSMFGAKDAVLWKGKLAIFVLKDRFGYEEFNQTIHDRRVPAEATGHSIVTMPTYEDAYIVLQDVGDTPDFQSPGLQFNLIDHLTGAFLQRADQAPPDWLLRGTGLALAASINPKNVYVEAMPSKAAEALKSLERPEDVFADNRFSPADVGPVGFTLVRFLINAGGAPKFGQFVKSLQNGTNLRSALTSVYKSNMDGVAREYGKYLASQLK